MKRHIIYGFLIGITSLILLSAVIIISLRVVATSSMMGNLVVSPIDTTFKSIINPIYDDIWGTIYHAEVRQCDATPTITGDGSKINPYKASEQRWIAISQEMLDCEWRMGLLNDSTSALYRGKIEYGDTVWIESPYPQINGWWIVHDTKNSRYRGTIDFLQTKGDGNLYNYDPMWNGKFDNIRIFSMNDAELLGLTNPMT